MNKPQNKTPWWIFLLITAGIVMRCVHLLFIPLNTPFHLGGLFYEFSRQIILDNFTLPQTIPYYSLGGIPFAYPPLPFYLQAALMRLFNPPQFLTVNLMPVLIAAGTVPAFYWMICALTKDEKLRGAALFAFAFMPSAYVNQIEGAGLPEACGTLVLLFYLGFLFRYENSSTPLRALWAGVFLGLCVLASPGSAYGGVLFSLLFFLKILVKDAQKRSFVNSAWLILTGLTGLLVSSPYWLTVWRHIGFNGMAAPFLAQQDALAFLNQIRQMILFKPADSITFVADEGVYGFLFDWLVFAGLIWAILNQRIFQGIIFFTFWLIPREGSWLVAIPAACLAAYGLIHIVQPWFLKAFTPINQKGRLPLAPGILAMVLCLLVVAESIFALHDLILQPAQKISRAQIEALHAQQARIPSTSHVLVAGNAALLEWAPALLQREVLNCVFGLEWQPEEFTAVSQINAAIQAHNLPEAMAGVRNYSGDTDIWLVGDPQEVAVLLQYSSPSIHATVQVETPELVFLTLQAKKTKE